LLAYMAHVPRCPPSIIFVLSPVDCGSLTTAYRSCALAIGYLHSPPSRFVEHQLEMDTEEHHNDVQAYAINDNAEHYPMNQLDNTGVLVKPKWRGTNQDKMDMETLGRNQVVRVRRRSHCARTRCVLNTC